MIYDSNIDLNKIQLAISMHNRNRREYLNAVSFDFVLQLKFRNMASEEENQWKYLRHLAVISPIERAAERWDCG